MKNFNTKKQRLPKHPLFANPEVQAEYENATPKRKAWMMRQRNQASWGERHPREMERLLEKDQ